MKKMSVTEAGLPPSVMPLEEKQPPLYFLTKGVAGEPAVRGNDPVTGNNHRYRHTVFQLWAASGFRRLHQKTLRQTVALKMGTGSLTMKTVASSARKK